MNIERIEIDSNVFGRNVLTLKDVTQEDNLAAAEISYREEFKPVYVSCRVPMENIAVIHRLEQQGFKMIECQIRSMIRFNKDYDIGRYPYFYEQVTTEAQLNDVLEIAGSTVTHDRFSVDPEVPAGISGSRYKKYVEKSFRSSNECVWRLYDPIMQKTLNFRTYRRINSKEALLLLGGVHADYKNLGIGVIASYFFMNQMRQCGFSKATTHISAINYPVFNLEIGHLGFRVNGTFAVLRKVYT